MAAARPRIMLIVRGLRTKLSREEFLRRTRERQPKFRELPD